MILNIDNVGIIKKAQVKLDGITVIAGLNDSGKSTVGKLIFSIVKAFSRCEQDFDADRKKEIFDSVEKLYFYLRRQCAFQEYTYLKDEFFPTTFFNEISKYLSFYDIVSTHDLLNDKTDLINGLAVSDKVKRRLLNYLLNISKLLELKSNKNSMIKKALNMALNSEFNFELTNKITKLNSDIVLKEQLNDILSIEIASNSIKKINIFDELNISDATYLESPIILQLHDLISNSSAFSDAISYDTRRSNNGSKVPFHIKDLIEKLEANQYVGDVSASNSELVNTISEIIHGTSKYEKDKRDFIYNKQVNDKYISIKTNNIASGIKSFNILELLLKGNFFNENGILIIDEPENHLHPQWQVVYSEILVKIAQSTDSILLINSHSPYIIEGISHFCKKNAQHGNFYYANKDNNDGMTTIDDVTNDLNIIFEKLSAPLQRLVWE